MSESDRSAVYHLARAGQMPPGRLVHPEDRPGGQADIYLDPLHIRPTLVRELNWLSRHQVGNGLWRQHDWTHDGRMQEPAQDLGVAFSRWEIVPGAVMPRGHAVIPVEERARCIWLIREGECTAEMRDAMNEMLGRVAGDGLWRQSWYDRPEPHPGEGPAVLPYTFLLPACL
jgi:hypothetical protein